ncbi:MAG: pyridoxal-dependent decarboxylase, partial [Acidobacteriota bacterium]|nr:pyridoxal-dependent decarboxylase [Acidobacteriota bacterium]
MDEHSGNAGRRPGRTERSGSPSPSVAREGRDGLQMAPDFMRELAGQAAEMLVQRIEGLHSQDAWDGDFREALEASLLEEPPEDGQPAADVLRRAEREVLRFATRLDHPRCFAFVPSSPTWPGVLADFLAAGYNINAVNWLVASGPSQVELVVLEWFRRWLGYPEGAGGIFTSGGSSATLNALVAAREAAGNPERPVVYLSDQ